jgi:hypothetical protein
MDVALSQLLPPPLSTHHHNLRSLEEQWRALCSSLDALPDGPTLDLAISRALATAAHWPHHIRRAPIHWIQRLLLKQHEPRLLLVRSLALHQTNLTDHDVHTLSRSPLLRALSILRLDHAPLTCDAISSLATSPHLLNLQELYLNHHPNDGIQDLGLITLTTAPFLHHLRVLSLAHQHISSHGLLTLLNSSHNLHNLQELYLDDNPLDDAALIALAHCRDLHNLQRLGLSRCTSRDAGLRALLRRLDEHFPHLIDVNTCDSLAPRHLCDALDAALRSRW